MPNVPLPELMRRFTPTSSGNSYSVSEGDACGVAVYVAGFWAWVVFVGGETVAGALVPGLGLEGALRCVESEMDSIREEGAT
jgi:hypothetical protein